MTSRQAGWYPAPYGRSGKALARRARNPPQVANLPHGNEEPPEKAAAGRIACPTNLIQNGRDLRNLARTIAVVHSRVYLECSHFSFRIGAASSDSISNGLFLTMRSNRPMVMRVLILSDGHLSPYSNPLFCDRPAESIHSSVEDSVDSS